MAGTADKKRFADAVVSRFGKTMGPATSASDEPDDDDAPGGTDNESGAMFRAALKSGDNAALCEAIRRIAG